jgi:SAM-dependent methyltransferase
MWKKSPVPRRRGYHAVMKTRESGMPDEATWAGFFSPEATLRKLGLHEASGSVVDFGCGYGTFSIPAARVVGGTVFAIDIDQTMVDATRIKAAADGLTNVSTIRRDFVADGTGLPDASVGYAMLFNILHCEHPGVLLGEARRVLSPGGTLAIIHWNPDPATPRGPSMPIRPTPDHCRALAISAGFAPGGPQPIDLPPYHYGLMLHQAW